MNTNPLVRSERLGIRIEPELRRMLDELVAETGLSLSDVIRQAVRREHANLRRKKEKRNA